MDNYTTITQHLENLITIVAPGFRIPATTWILENENTVTGAYGGEEKTWLRGGKDAGIYSTITVSYDEEGLPEEEHVLIWPTGLPENLSVSIQSAPDFFNPEIEQLTLNLTAPASQLSEILGIKTDSDDGFSFFKKLTEKCFPEFAVKEEHWQKVEGPDPLDDSQSTEGTMVQVMGTDDYGFRRTVESYIEENSSDEAAIEAVIFTASGLPLETEMTMSATIPPAKKEQLFALHITAVGDIFKEILNRLV